MSILLEFNLNRFSLWHNNRDLLLYRSKTIERFSKYYVGRFSSVGNDALQLAS